MDKKLILSLLIIAVASTFGTHAAEAIISAQISAPNVSVSINGYLPAPPGVFIQLDAGRPYYVERERRIYMEKRPVKRHKREKKDHDDHGHNHGHND